MSVAQNAELIESARKAEPCQPDIIKLTKQLPKSDKELTLLMSELIESLEAEAFSNIWIASHWDGRDIPGSLFENGTQLLQDPAILFPTAPRCAATECREEGNLGETSRALIGAADSGRLGNEREMCALIMAAECWRISCGNEAPYPKRLGFLSRKIGRAFCRFGFDFSFDYESQLLQESFVLVLAHYMQDDSLFRSLEERGIEYDRESAEKLAGRTIEYSLKEILPKERPARVLSGYQVRRAAPKIGRNEPCHCGSGKKYKRCCAADDQERLSRSSAVEGMTIEELELEREERLTHEDVRRMRPYEIIRLDPSRFSKEVIRPVCQRLMLYEELDHIFVIHEKSSCQSAKVWKDIFFDVIHFALEQNRSELVERVLSEHPDLEEDFSSPLEFLRAAGDPEAGALLIESRCREALKLEDEEAAEENGEDEKLNPYTGLPAVPESSMKWADLAFNILQSDFPHLGVVVARAAILSINPVDVETLVDEIEDVRDSLGLTPFDFANEVAELGDDLEAKRFLTNLDKRVGAKLADRVVEQTEELKDKQRELDEVKESLAKSKRHARAAEKEAELAQARLEEEKKSGEGDGNSPHHEQEIHRLRDKLETLKSEVKRKHEQRNELRRELRSARSAVAKASEDSDDRSDDPAAAKDDEESLLGEDASSQSRKPRIPEFPEKFVADKQNLPENVLAHAIQISGRLAAGEESAFRGVRKLKLTQDCFRQKVGASYRLIFQIKDDRIKVMDLIHRKDLEKWLR